MVSLSSRVVSAFFAVASPGPANYTCKGTTSCDPGTARMWKIDFEIRLTAQS